MTSRRSFLGWIIGVAVAARFSFLFPSAQEEGTVSLFVDGINAGKPTLQGHQIELPNDDDEFWSKSTGGGFGIKHFVVKKVSL